MTDAKQPAQFDWATELSDAQGHVTLSEQEAKEIGARLRSMGEKLKTYEDLGGAADDVQLLRMGYAAARLEIESLKSERDRFRAAYHEWSDKTEWVRKSTTVNELGKHLADVLRERIEGLQAALKAAQPVAAPQPGAAYAALPEPHHRGPAGTGNYFSSFTADQMRAFADTTCAMRAAHGQAPAGVALPEGWVPLVITHEGQYPEEIAYGPQRMMDRLGKWLRKYFDSVVEAKAQAAPAAVAGADEIDRLRAALVYVAFALHGTRQYMLAEGVTLIDGDTVRVSRDGWTVEASSNPLRQPEPQPSPAAQGDENA